MLKDKSNSRKQGDVGLGCAISWFTEKEYTVCIPLTDSQDYDLVIETEDGLKKIQVRTTFATTKHGIYKVNLRVCGGNKSGSTVKMFDPSKVDYLFAMTEEGTRYFVPSDKITCINVLNLGKKQDEYIV